MAGLCGMVRFEGQFRPASAGLPAGMRRLLAATQERGPEVALRQTPPAVLAASDWERPDRLTAHGNGVWVVADARLDHRDELIQDLDARPTATTAELILAAYERWGEEMASRLRGEFAVAVWDENRRTLVLARDPLGIKPLHYVSLPGSNALAFAGEAWPLARLRSGGETPVLDRLAVARYLSGLERGRERSFFEEVRPVEPGRVLGIDAGGSRTVTYWDPAAVPRVRHRRPEDYAEELREQLRRSVARRVADAGTMTGVAMSGGLDSCAVAALAQRASPATAAFSLTFAGLPSCDESPGIDAMETVVGMPVDRIPTADHLAWAAVDSVGDAPLLVWEGAFAEMTRRLRARGGRVLLTGHGADDLLGGSPLMLAARLQGGDAAVVREVLVAARRHGFPPVRTLYRRLVRPFLPPLVDRAVGRLGGRAGDAGPPWLHPDLKALLHAHRPPVPPSRRRARELARQQLLDTVRRLPGLEETLSWTDRVASRAGIEIRHPFLDRELVEWVLGVPPELLFGLDAHKPLLRRAVGELLPPEVLERPAKARLGAHVDDCVRREWPRLQPWLRASRLADLGLVLPARLASSGAGGEPPREIYRAVFLEGWWRRHVSSISTGPEAALDPKAFAA